MLLWGHSCVFSAHSILENVLENPTWKAEVKTSNRDGWEEKPSWVWERPSAPGGGQTCLDTGRSVSCGGDVNGIGQECKGSPSIHSKRITYATLHASTYGHGSVLRVSAVFILGNGNLGVTSDGAQVPGGFGSVLYDAVYLEEDGTKSKDTRVGGGGQGCVVKAHATSVSFRFTSCTALCGSTYTRPFTQMSGKTSSIHK